MVSTTVAANGGNEPCIYGQIEGTDFVVLDKRFRAAVRGLYPGRPAVDGRGLVGGPGLVRRRALSRLVGHSQQPHAALRRGVGPRLGLPPALEQFERQHRRQPGTARHLRASDAPRHPHRDRRLDHGPRRQVAGQALQLAQRRRRQVGRFDLVHRSGLRHRQRQRGRPRVPRDRRLPRLPHRSEDPAKSTRVIDDMVRPNGLAFSPDEKLLYVADTGATHKERAAPYPPLRRVAPTARA